MDFIKEAIIEWYERFAPGLLPQQVPENAKVHGIALPLVPYGLQFLVTMPDGSSFPRQQSGPGATIAVIHDTASGVPKAIAKKELREESGETCAKFCGGFAGYNRNVASDMVRVYNNLDGSVIDGVLPSKYPHLYEFFLRLMAREYGSIITSPPPIFYIVDKPVGYPNIKICSVMGYVMYRENLLAGKEDEAEKLGLFDQFYDDDNTRMGDENSDRLLVYLFRESENLEEEYFSLVEKVKKP
jgi:hypothetical protein